MVKTSAISSNVKELAKAFRGSSCIVSQANFSEPLEDVLEKHFELFVDMWKIDMYAPEVDIRQAVRIAKGLDLAVCVGIGKSIKACLTAIHYKRRRLTSGERSPGVLLRFLKEVEETKEPTLPLGNKRQKTGKSQPSPVFAKSASSSSSIAALYGLAAATADPQLSQITVSDDPEDLLTQSDIVVASQETGLVYGHFFDQHKGCVVRTLRSTDGLDVVTEMSSMQAGKAGFAEAVFANGDVHVSEIPNMDLWPEKVVCQKKPACRKKPANADLAMTSQSEDDEAEGQVAPKASEVAPEASEVAPKASGVAPKASEAAPSEVVKPAQAGKPSPAVLFCTETWKMPCGTSLKFGPFSGQSYITYKKKLQLKFQLLSCCSDLKAARNGKKHQAVIKALFEHLKTLQSLPSKEVCGAFVLEQLAN